MATQRFGPTLQYRVKPCYTSLISVAITREHNWPFLEEEKQG